PARGGAAAAVHELGEAVVAASGQGPLAAAAATLDAPEIASNAAIVLFGGIETSEGMIASALVHLLSDPDALAWVLEDPAARLAGAVEESLRLEPAAAVVDRYATRDVALGDARIAAGDLVRISITAANRDPAAFPDPDRFDPARPDARRHLAFASGPHVCIGMHLARLEADRALRAVLALPGLRLDPDRPAPQMRGLVFRKPDAVHAVWDAG
ncbi:MAG TPA: cytochrome P450, partial [Solirubrobacteraceae bacterium]